MTDREAMQALLKGEVIINALGDQIRRLSGTGNLVDLEGNFVNSYCRNTGNDGWQIYESRQAKIKRLAARLRGILEDRDGTWGKMIPISNELIDSILEEEDGTIKR